MPSTKPDSSPRLFVSRIDVSFVLCSLDTLMLTSAPVNRSCTATRHPRPPPNASASSADRATTSTTSSAESELSCHHTLPFHLPLTTAPCDRYVWLVPQYTTDPSAAVVGFEVVIQENEDKSLSDLAKGAGGDYRYLLPIKDVTQQRKVTAVALVRTGNAADMPPPGWDGATIDINKGRGKTYLYLVWKVSAEA